MNDQFSYGASRIESCQAIESIRSLLNPTPDDMNLIVFGTSGVHGSGLSIDEAFEEGLEVTFLIIRPRLVHMFYGNAPIKDKEDYLYLKSVESKSNAILKSWGEL